MTETKLVPNILVAVMGNPKVGKTHFAMTFPDPIKVYSFDMGTKFVRARSFPKKTIDITEYALPIIETGSEKGWAIPLWEKFEQDFGKDCASGTYKTLVIDPATVLWMINHHAELEEEQKNKLGVQAYYKPNLRFGALYYKAAIGGMNLVTIHHLKDEYENYEDNNGRTQSRKTGNFIIDGWKRTESAADVNLVMELGGEGAKTYSVSTVKSCRFDRTLKGQTFIDLDYNKMMAVLGL